MNTNTQPGLAPSLAEVRLLGGFTVRRVDGAAVKPSQWRTTKAAALMRLLALRPDQPVSTEFLTGILWPDADQARAEASLRTALWHVRSALGSTRIERSRVGIQLSGAWVDVVAYRDLTTRISRLVDQQRFAEVTELASSADALYRGALDCTGLTAEWVLTEARTLAIQQQELLCDAAEAALHERCPHQATTFARRALADDGFNERATRLLMEAHLDLGETSYALREYHRCRRLLADELGVDPAPQTVAVYQAALTGGRQLSAASA